MLIECNKCGAPLDVNGRERVVRCRYCGTSSKVRETRTIAAVTPASFQPPQAWTPPAHASMPSTPLTYRRRRSSPSAMLACLPLLLVGGGVLAALAASGAVELPFGGKVSRWDGQSTLTCGMNEELVIEEREATVAAGPVIEATGPNCRVIFRRSRMSGATIVRGGVNTEVVVEDSTLEATDVAIVGSPNLKVRLSGESTVRGGARAIVGDVNMELSAHGPVTIASDGDAIVSELNLALVADGATIRAGGVAISGTTNPEARLTRTRVEGGVGAIRFERNAEVHLRECELKGATDYGRNANVTQ